MIEIADKLLSGKDFKLPSQYIEEFDEIIDFIEVTG